MNPGLSDETLRSLAELRDSGRKLSVHVACTGAGAGLQRFLWSLPGCSKYFSGGSFPYDGRETERLLGFRPKQFVSRETAVDLAIASFMRAVGTTAAEPIGIGLTASVASTEPHNGKHRFHVATLTRDACKVTSIVLKKDSGIEARSRDGFATDVIALCALFHAIGQPQGHAVGELDGMEAFAAVEEDLELSRDAGDLALSRLLEHPIVTSSLRRRPSTDVEADRTIFHAGTFDPPHDGHIAGARAACDAHSGFKDVSARLLHSITLDPPHKPRLSVATALERAVSLSNIGRDVLVSVGDHLFVDKAERFPGAAHVLGADAALKILSPKWGDVGKTLARLEAARAKIYVIGREVQLDDGRIEFVTVSHPAFSRQVPTRFTTMFRHVPGRWDVSSTQLRSARDD